MKQKFLPDYLEETTELLKKIALILDAVYGEEADKEIEKEKANADAKSTKKAQAGEKPKGRGNRAKGSKA